MKSYLALVWLLSTAVLSDALAGEIHNAAASGDVDKVGQLLDKDPKLLDAEDQTTLMGLTPLHVAAKRGQKEVVELLLARGAKPDPKWAVNGMTPLILAAQEGYIDVVKLLLAQKANPNNVANGMAALHWSARRGDIEVARSLIDAGADINIRDSFGKTPLQEASQSGKKEMVEFLLSKGADINATDNSGKTSWNLATDHPDTTDLLQRHGAAGSAKVIDVVLNHGNRFANSRTVEIDPLSVTFPQLWLSLDDPFMRRPTILQNPGKPFSYTLPEQDAEYHVFLRFADANGTPQGPLLFKMIELDTIPPVVKITSPADNSTTDQGFVHVQATVFDPDPKDPTEPGMGRRVAVWINGERYWNFGSVIFNATNIDIPRFPIQDGPNTLSIVAADEASNRTEAVVHWSVNLGLDKTRPVLSDIQLHPDKSGKVILPDDPEVVVMGHLDDAYAIVTATVNGGEPIRMNVITEKRVAPVPVFAYKIPLNEGENTVVFSAINGAGNASDYRYTVVRSKRYRAKLAGNGGNPMLPRVVEGYVSALRDAGTPTEAHVVSVFVNDVPTTLAAVDPEGNIRFKTTEPLSLVWHGYVGLIYTRIRWSDGEEY